MVEETYPEDLKYSKEHDWVRAESDEAVLGITWFAQDALGEVVYADVPALGVRVTSGQPFGELESVKAVSDVYSPLTGQVVATNESILDEPERVNTDCYGDGWLIRVHMDDPAEVDALMNADEYRAFLEEI